MAPRPPSVRHPRRLAAFVAAGTALAGVVIAWRHVVIDSPVAVFGGRYSSPALSLPSAPEDEKSPTRLSASAHAPDLNSAPSSEPAATFAAALSRAEHLSDPDEREVARANVFAAWAEADARAVFLHFAAHEAGEPGRYRRGVYFRLWARRDFKAALDYADRETVENRREEMLGWVALVVAEADPAEAATIADRDMRPGPERVETSMAILHQWARVDLSRAAVWADSFPHGPVRDRALDEVAGFMRDVPPARSAN